MSLLNKKSYAPLEAGTYTAVIKSFKDEESKGYEYVKMEATLIEQDNRPVNFNLFESQLNYFIKGIRQQLFTNDNGAYDFITILEAAQQEPIKLYITYNTKDGKTYRNISTVEPKPITVTTTEEEF